MAFRTKKGSSLNLDTPVTMYADIRPRKIASLFPHQETLLNAYATDENRKRSDIALPLPTGSGKTLVGICLAEWRRRRFEERVVYLCPTRQLAKQVVTFSNDLYGIKAHAFVGRVKEYDAAAKADWNAGEAIAVTTYTGGLFHESPFFTDPHCIILDDAHSADSYIASYWSVQITRSEEPVLFDAVVSILRPIMPAYEHVKMSENSSDTWDAGWVDMLPMTRLLEIAPQLTAAIDERAPATRKVKYAWKRIREHLFACNMFLGASEILIRPLISPTDTFAPFSNAGQRVYMSATLGTGGELERISGRRHIHRLPAPTGYDRQAVGRRLFMFPGRSLNDDDSRGLALRLMQEAGRSLVLAPSASRAEAVRKQVEERLDFSTFDADQIEDSKKPFTDSTTAVAIIANRYDGIDFPGDECRLIIVDGLPRAINLQERFLIDRMSAVAILAERIRTRVIQAVGRCTRSDDDYSAVLILGEELSTYLEKREGRSYMHPELQAELVFGMDESKDRSIADFIENFQIFLQQDESWADVNESIIAKRKNLKEKPLPAAANLAQTAIAEIDYVNALWNEQYEIALERCRQILPHLKQGAPVRGYDGFWTYLAGVAAWLAFKQGGANLETAALQYFESAAKIVPGYRWLSRPKMLGVGQYNGEADPMLLEVLYRLELRLETIGTLHNHKFERELKAIEDDLAKNDAQSFERGQVAMGKMLGYDSRKDWKNQGAPDPYWIADESLCFVFEDHSDGKADGSLDVTKARQAATHVNWIRSNVKELDPMARIVTILVSPVLKADNAALPHLEEVYFWPLEDYRSWARRAMDCLRELHVGFSGTGDLVWQAKAAQQFQTFGLDPNSLIKMLEENRASERLDESL